jgi:hypothetical protein
LVGELVALLPVVVVAPGEPVLEPGVVVEVPEPGRVDGMLVEGVPDGSVLPDGEALSTPPPLERVLGVPAVFDELLGLVDEPKVPVPLSPPLVTPLPPTPVPPTEVPGPAEPLLVPPTLEPLPAPPALVPPAALPPAPACANATPDSASGAVTTRVCTIFRIVMQRRGCNRRATFAGRLQLRALYFCTAARTSLVPSALSFTR